MKLCDSTKKNETIFFQRGEENAYLGFETVV